MKSGNKQNSILRFIEKYQKEYGWAPSIREICRETKIESTATVHVYLKKLEKEGFIQRMSGAPRAIKLLKTYNGAEKRSA